MYNISKSLGVELNDLLNSQPVQTNHNQSGGDAIALNKTLNIISEKLIEQYEKQIWELENQLSKYEK